jgi:putative endonuclease
MHPTYKRMLAGLKKEKSPAHGKKVGNDWSLYILQCRDGSLYTGITNHLERRLKMHQNGKASRYTRTRRPVEMLYSETCGDRSRALIRECEVKEWPKKKKEALVRGEEKISRVKEAGCTGKRTKSSRRTLISSADLRVSASRRRSASKDNPEQGPLLQAGSLLNSEIRSIA